MYEKLCSEMLTRILPLLYHSQKPLFEPSEIQFSLHIDSIMLVFSLSTLVYFSAHASDTRGCHFFALADPSTMKLCRVVLTSFPLVVFFATAPIFAAVLSGGKGEKTSTQKLYIFMCLDGQHPPIFWGWCIYLRDAVVAQNQCFLHRERLKSMCKNLCRFSFILEAF